MTFRKSTNPGNRSRRAQHRGTEKAKDPVAVPEAARSRNVRSDRTSDQGRRNDRTETREIGHLTNDRIASMTRDELIPVIRTSDVVLPQEGTRHRLEYLDRSTLERLVHLVRHCRT